MTAVLIILILFYVIRGMMKNLMRTLDDIDCIESNTNCYVITYTNTRGNT